MFFGWLQRYATFSWTLTDERCRGWSGRNGSTRRRQMPWWSDVSGRSSVELRKLLRLREHVPTPCTRPSQCIIIAPSTFTPALSCSLCPSHQISLSDFVRKLHSISLHLCCVLRLISFCIITCLLSENLEKACFVDKLYCVISYNKYRKCEWWENFVVF